MFPYQSQMIYEPINRSRNRSMCVFCARPRYQTLFIDHNHLNCERVSNTPHIWDIYKHSKRLSVGRWIPMRKLFSTENIELSFFLPIDFIDFIENDISSLSIEMFLFERFSWTNRPISICSALNWRTHSILWVSVTWRTDRWMCVVYRLTYAVFKEFHFG